MASCNRIALCRQFDDKPSEGEGKGLSDCAVISGADWNLIIQLSLDNTDLILYGLWTGIGN